MQTVRGGWRLTGKLMVMDVPPLPAPHDLFEGLTDAQRQAVAHVDGPVLVLAGPGSGKTTVVTRRVAHLIASGIPPWQILALTFTNKAAGEMRERIERLIPPDLPGKRGLTIATFHSFCVRVLRRYAQAAGLSARFSIYDSADQREALKQALKESEIDSKHFTPAMVHGAISHAKNALIDAEAFRQNAGDFQARTIARAYSAYQKILRRNDALDFDDLLVITAKLLRANEQVRRELQERFQYLLIDEYQDTNYAQFTIAHALASAHRNICVVGDPDQSIYGWRGADIRNILEFEEHYPNTKIIPLGQNFRSTSHIVESAAALIQHNKKRKHKRLFTELGDGEKPTVVMCFDEHHEARLIVDEFRRRHDEGSDPAAAGGESGGAAWKDMAVLYRINALSRVLEEAFRNAGIPYVIARGTAFYERKEIKDALAYLRMVANPNDEVSLRRIVNVPARGIGSTTLEKIEMWALNRQLNLFEGIKQASRGGVELTTRAAGAIARFTAMVEMWRDAAASGAFEGLMGTRSTEKAALAELVERIIKESGLEAMYRNKSSEEDIERLENLNELINAAADFAPPPPELGELPAREMTLLEALNSWLEAVTLVSDADAIDPASGAVTLMTLHAAKGLEFDVVAMAGLEEGILPHARAQMAATDAELEEERRLCFVGITRARRHLLITRAAVRTKRGLPERTIPSLFLSELPEEHVIVSDQAGEVGGMDDEFVDPLDGGAQWGRSSYDAGKDWQRSKAPARSAATGGSRAAARDEFGEPIDRPPARLSSAGRSSVEQAFPVGSLVRHPTFGLGRVEIVTPRARGSSVQVAFNTAGRKTLIVEFAKLQRVE
jgi:DNA helicase II / ATP-dependent DNA helicase PcrA